MLSLSRPSIAAIEQFLARQRHAAFNYRQVGATRGQPPAGYDVDQSRRDIGRGAPAFSAAKAALARWAQLHTGWTELFPAAAPIATGTTVAVLSHVGGLWSLDPCRIIYVVDEPAAFGFGYGTLTGHAEMGEERFQVEFDQPDGTVWYGVKAFFRPRRLLARLGWLYLRRVVSQFRADSAGAMRRAVSDATQEPTKAV
jgi:uncharacterized protein (UPF0548 family)